MAIDNHQDILCVGAEPPRVLHYGLLFEVKGHGYSFDKAWFHEFDPQQCSPWDLSVDRPTAGLFPLAPSPSSFTEVTVCCYKIQRGTELVRDIYALQFSQLQSLRISMHATAAAAIRQVT